MLNNWLHSMYNIVQFVHIKQLDELECLASGE